MEEIIKLQQQLTTLNYQHWLKEELFSWVWWLGVFSMVVFPLVWWKLVDKKRVLEIGFFGSLICITALYLDVVGSEYLLWFYAIRIIPQTAFLCPVDFVCYPVAMMLLYQKYNKWRQYLVASTVAAAIFAFVIEPLDVLIGQYVLISWRFIYSFPIYILIAVFCKLLVKKFKWIENKCANQI